MSLRDGASMAFTEAHGFEPLDGLPVRYSVFPHGSRLPATLRFKIDEDEWVIQTHGETQATFHAQGMAGYCYAYAAHDVTPATCDYTPPCDQHTDDPTSSEPCGVWVSGPPGSRLIAGGYEPVEVVEEAARTGGD